MATQNKNSRNGWTRDRLNAEIAKHVSASSPPVLQTLATNLRKNRQKWPDSEIERGLRELQRASATQGMFDAAGVARQQELSERVILVAVVRELPALHSSEIVGGTCGRAEPWEHTFAQAQAATQKEQRRCERLQAAIERLSPDKREVFELKHALDRVTFAEVARELGIPESSAHYLYHSAARDIRRYLARDGQSKNDDLPINNAMGVLLQSGGSHIRPDMLRSDGDIVLSCDRLTVHKGNPEKARLSSAAIETGAEIVRGAEADAMQRLRVAVGDYV